MFNIRRPELLFDISLFLIFMIITSIGVFIVDVIWVKVIFILLFGFFAMAIGHTLAELKFDERYKKWKL